MFKKSEAHYLFSTTMTIVITLPHFFHGEATLIAQMLQGQVALVHIRKPQASAEEVERLIKEIPTWCRKRLVLHDHHPLAQKYHLYGIHLNSRNPLPPKGWTGSVSRSCHSLAEVEEWKETCNYVSLSPIYDSISKQGYHAAFTKDELCEAHRRGIIDERVMALGGVTFGKIDEVMAMGFGGGMILGDAWKSFSTGLTPVALTIAGSDSSAGAGIQQDVKTMAAIGVYAATVITAVTSQNTMGITDVMPMPPQVVKSQLDAVLSDLNVKVVKIGMLPNAEVAHVVADVLRAYKQTHVCAIILDPIMVSTSGRAIMDADCIRVVIRELFPLCTLITPNLLETKRIVQEMGDAALTIEALASSIGVNILVKGGHADADDLSDCLYLPDGEATYFATERIISTNLHGTGCTLSSAIAAYLLLNEDLKKAIARAKQLLTMAIKQGKNVHIGKGNGPLMLGRRRFPAS